MRVPRLIALCLSLGVLGALAAPDEAELPLQAGQLRDAGGYAHPPGPHTLTRLDDGSLLQVGLNGFGLWRPAAGRAALLHRHAAALTGGAEPDPKLWDATARGWLRLPALPHCPAGRYALHTALKLPDGRVWLAGGVCDLPRMADDESPRSAFSATQFWNPRQRAWEPGPDTAQQRLLHSATLLDDGSAVLAGGMADPVVVQLADQPVLRSVQRWAAGALQSLPDLLHARAKHSATALAGGRLLVAGGFGSQGQALASAELWDPAQAAWQALPPLAQPRYGHAALALGQGRVLVLGGLDAQHQPLRSAELYDPAQQRWMPVPALPVPLAEPGAAVLDDGRVLVAGGLTRTFTVAVPWAWVWQPGAADWQLAGRLSAAAQASSPTPVSIWPEAGGRALLAAQSGFLRYVPLSAEAPAARAAPVWLRRPEAAALDGGRALWVGQVDDEESAPAPQAWLWDESGGWQRTAAPPLPAWAELQLLTMPGGEALLLARHGPFEAARLDAWLWRAGRWQGAAGIPLLPKPKGGWAASRLPDGRFVLLQDTEQLWLADAQVQSWVLRAAAFDGPLPGAGAPVLSVQPMAHFADGGRQVPLDEAAYRYLARRDPLHFPSLAWDGANQRWFYNSHPRDMGHESLLLPGGCVLSPRPLALFDPRDGQARPQPDPGLGSVGAERRVLPLPDGRLLVSGPGQSADRGGVELLLRGSCSGLAAPAGSAVFIDARWAPKLAPAAAAPATALLAEPTEAPSAQRTLSPQLAWWLVAGLLAAWAVRRVRRWQAAPVGAAAPQRTAWPLLAALRWALGLLLVGWAVSAAWQLWRFQRVQDDDACAASAKACPRDDQGLLPLAPSVGQRLGATVRSELPCPLIGDWLSTRGGGPGYRVALRDDGRYRVTATGTGRQVDSTVYTGAWAVQGDSLVWRPDEMPSAPLDVTPIEPESLTRFVLREADGSRTRYERLKALPSTRCTPKDGIP